jgi:hypothetical protein
MRKKYLFIVFLLVLLVSCSFLHNESDQEEQVVGGGDVQANQEAVHVTHPVSDSVEPTPTQTQTPMSAVGSMVYGTGTLRYMFEVKDQDLLVGEGEVEFPFEIMKPISDSTPHYFRTTLQGGQVVRVAGMNSGERCYVTYTYTVTYDLNGDFYPDECKFDFTLETFDETLTAEVEDGCGVPGGMDTNIYFFPPPSGPHVIIGEDVPLVIKPDPRVTHTFIIEDLDVPSDANCW